METHPTDAGSAYADRTCSNLQCEECGDPLVDISDIAVSGGINLIVELHCRRCGTRHILRATLPPAQEIKAKSIYLRLDPAKIPAGHPHNLQGCRYGYSGPHNCIGQAKRWAHGRPDVLGIIDAAGLPDPDRIGRDSAPLIWQPSQ